MRSYSLDAATARLGSIDSTSTSIDVIGVGFVVQPSKLRMTQNSLPSGSAITTHDTSP
jgi:hypothetical protein